LDSATPYFPGRSITTIVITIYSVAITGTCRSCGELRIRGGPAATALDSVHSVTGLCGRIK
jgi:hypothetical protein